jgi:class 3 adenylate cyclase/tetratricopeptide (TPR) repeat protein
MTCPRCQHENPPGSNFCLGCGARLGLTCSSCGTVLPAGSRFCNKCGTAVTTATAAPPSPSPQSYTPKHLAERILTSKAALEGERKQVTVLFADLKGSMELLADRDPEEARKLLDPVLELMMEAVHRYEGTINQVMGDGIMALFGAPLAHEDHAVRACYAALAMRETLAQHGAALRRSDGVEVRIRVGLNSGEVVVRAIESDLRMDYSAVGQTTHLAARMEQLAAPGTIRLTADTLRLVESRVEVNPLGPVPIKGLPHPVEVFELVGASTRRTRLDCAMAQGLTQFVGREAELKMLHHTLEQAQAGRGQIVAVVGEAGVGKSRLVLELTRSPCAAGWLIVHASAVSYGTATPQSGLIDLLRAYFQIEPGDQPRRVREKVSGKLLALDETLLPLLSALLALLDGASEDARWQGLDPRERRQQTLEACRRLLLRQSQVQPLLLAFEDLHWVDSETQAFLDVLAGSLAGARVLLLVDYRPPYRHDWAGKTYYTQLRVEPLPPMGAQELLGALLGTDLSVEPVKRLLIDRTEGNPFFLEETVKAMIETKALVGAPGAYRAAQVLANVEVPATVRAVLGARIDRLPPDVKRLLQSASVIGKDVPLSLLRAVADEREDELRRHLARLQSAELVYESALFPEVAYTFKHALTHDVTYASLLHERRRSLHAQIAAIVEQRAPEQVDRLAHHALRGELWDKAVIYLRRAGAKATAGSAYREAVAYFEQALDALDRLPRGKDTMALGIDIRLDLRTALTPLARYREILARLGEAETLARELHDDRRLGLVVADLSARLRNTGDHPGALEAGQRAVAVAARLGDHDLRIEATYRLSQAHFAVGEFARSIDLLRQVVEAFDREATLLQGNAIEIELRRQALDAASGVTPPAGVTVDPTRRPYVIRRPDWSIPAYFAAWPRAWLALGLASVGQFQEAMQYGAEAVGIAESVDHPHSVIEAQAALGRVHLARGDLDRAIALFERGLAPSRAWNLQDSSVFSGLGHAYALLGRVDEGLSLLREAVDKGHAMDAMGVGHAMRLVRLGEGCLIAGQLDEARLRALEALQLSRRQKERANEASALRLVGAVVAQCEPLQAETAVEHYGGSLALAEELVMRPLVAHCHLGLGKLYRRAGQRDQAREHLTTATAMYREMDMRFYLEQAEAELRGLS